MSRSPWRSLQRCAQDHGRPCWAGARPGMCRCSVNLQAAGTRPARSCDRHAASPAGKGSGGGGTGQELFRSPGSQRISRGPRLFNPPQPASELRVLALQWPRGSVRGDRCRPARSQERGAPRLPEGWAPGGHARPLSTARLDACVHSAARALRSPHTADGCSAVSRQMFGRDPAGPEQLGFQAAERSAWERTQARGPLLRRSPGPPREDGDPQLRGLHSLTSVGLPRSRRQRGAHCRLSATRTQATSCHGLALQCVLVTKRRHR